jgi:hypothetical protein
MPKTGYLEIQLSQARQISLPPVDIFISETQSQPHQVAAGVGSE